MERVVRSGGVRVKMEVLHADGGRPGGGIMEGCLHEEDGEEG